MRQSHEMDGAEERAGNVGRRCTCLQQPSLGEARGEAADGEALHDEREHRLARDEAVRVRVGVRRVRVRVGVRVTVIRG